MNYNYFTSIVKEAGAIPFNAPGEAIGQKEGKFSFESIIDRYGVKDPGLLRLAKTVHVTDVSEEINKVSIALGLEAITIGHNPLFPKDEENLTGKFEVSDALNS